MVRFQITLTLLGLLSVSRALAVDVYGAAATAQTLGLGNIYLGSLGATDALASNPALLSGLDRPDFELTLLGVSAAGQFHNSTPFVGTLQSSPGFSGSAGFGMKIPKTRLSIGFGVFPVSLLSDRWTYQDPPGTAGATYGIQKNKSAFLAIQSSAGLSYRISDRLFLGAAFGVVDNLNTLETPYIFQTNPTLAGLKTLLNLHTSGVGYNGIFGIEFKPGKRFEIAAAYKTRTAVRSTGAANGNVYAQFAALGLSAYPSGFHYNAEVYNVFPQSASLGLAWQAQRRLRTFLQGDWLDWRGAFVQLPVHLTGGNNALLNTLLHSTTLNDSVPLDWRNQFNVRTGVQFSLTESVTLLGAFSDGNSPVPASTLTPLTADVSTVVLSTGVSYAKRRYRVQLAYQVNLPEAESVGKSSLLAGEYNNTRVSLWLQTLALTTGIRF